MGQAVIDNFFLLHARRLKLALEGKIGETWTRSGGSILLSESGSNFLAIDTIERQHSFIWILPIMVAKITTAFGLGMILRN
jgi:hypothetical protein